MNLLPQAYQMKHKKEEYLFLINSFIVVGVLFGSLFYINTKRMVQIEIDYQKELQKIFNVYEIESMQKRAEELTLKQRELKDWEQMGMINKQESVTMAELDNLLRSIPEGAHLQKIAIEAGNQILELQIMIQSPPIAIEYIENLRELYPQSEIVFSLDQEGEEKSFILKIELMRRKKEQEEIDEEIYEDLFISYGS